MQIGGVYLCIALAYLLLLIPTGLLADHFISATYIYSILQSMTGLALFLLVFVRTEFVIGLAVFIASVCYVPTLALSNAIILFNCSKMNLDRSKEVPIIHILGSLGFVSAVWLVAFLDLSLSPYKYMIGMLSAFCTSLLPMLLVKVTTYPKHKFDFISFFHDMKACLCHKNIIVFLIVSIPIGILVQFSDLYSSTYLLDKKIPQFSIFNSISLISSIISGFFLIAFLKAFHFKTVILFALFFGL